MKTLLAALGIILALGTGAHAQQKFRNLPGSSLPPNTSDTQVGVQNGNDVQVPIGSAPYQFRVSAYGATGNGTADDTAAFTAALAACGTAGGGVVVVDPLRYLINSASLTVPQACRLEGNYAPGADKNFSKYTPTQPAILLNGSYTINMSANSALRHLAIFNSAVNALAISGSNLQGYIAYTAAFAGTAISTLGPDVTVDDLFIIGFNLCYTTPSTGGDRPIISNIVADCTNGFYFNNVQDIGYVNHVNMHTVLPQGFGNFSTPVSGVTSSGGLIELTVGNTSTLATGNTAFVFNVGGYTGANAKWVITVVDGTHVTLQNSQPTPTTTGIFNSGSNRIIVNSTNSLGYGQSVSGTNVGPGNTNTIAGIDRQAGVIFLSQPTTGSGNGTTLTFANPSYTSGGTLYISNDTRAGVAYEINQTDAVWFTNVFEYGWETGYYLTNTLSENNQFINAGCDMEQLYDPVTVCFLNLSTGLGTLWDGGQVSGSYMADLYDTTVTNSAYSNISFTVAEPGAVPISINSTRVMISNSTMINAAGQSVPFGSAYLNIGASVGAVNLAADYFPYLQLVVEPSYVNSNTNSLAQINVDFSTTLFGWLYTPPGDNLLLNPGFVLDQPNESNGATNPYPSSSGAMMDGWHQQAGNLGGGTVSYARNSSTAPGASNEILITTTGTGTPTSAGFLLLEARIEGSRLNGLGWGTFSAQPVSLSFWEKCSVAGTYAVNISNNPSGNNRVLVEGYTLAAGVWTLETFTIPGDKGGSWTLSGNSAQASVSFPLSAGSTNQTSTFGQWQSSSAALGASGQVQLSSNASATCEITEVKLERGPRPTIFVARSLADELTQAQRYYVKSFPQGTAPAQNLGTGNGETLVPSIVSTSGTVRSNSISFPVPMASSPSITFYNPAASNTNCRDETAAADGGAGTAVGTTANGFQATCTAAASGSANDNYGFGWTADARL